MRLEEKQEREKQRVAKTAKQREAILGVLSTLSKAAVAYIDEQAEEKVKDDYHRENHKLMLGDVSTELQQKIIADVGNHHALDIHEVGVNSLANASEANGASPLDTARLRQTGKGLSTGAYRARMEV